MSSTRTGSRWGLWAGLVICLLPQVAWAAVDPEVQVMIDTLWVVICGILVFFMNAGFGLLETGLCRAKNAVNILAKNFAVAACAGLAFYAVGFGFMFGDGSIWIGTNGFFLLGEDTSPAMGDSYIGVFSALSWTGVPLEAKFFFQVCFAMAAASIVSGAVAERIKFPAFIAFALVLTAVIYPTAGHWIWGGGLLSDFGFVDFAGSTAVHTVGGWAALIGAVLLGPRKGKFDHKEPLAAHNLALATAGAFILWLGWFGFNAGSTMAADATAIAHIATTTMLASLAGIAGAVTTRYTISRSFDLTYMINGALSGLVAITAPCAFVSLSSAVCIGLIGGILVVPATALLERRRIDDPVGAISVHLFGGVWGTLAVGLFAESIYSADVGNGLFFEGGPGLLISQFYGVTTVGLFTLSVSFFAWKVIDKLIGLRVDEEEEAIGLDLAEMGMSAYGEAVVPLANVVSLPVDSPGASDDRVTRQA
ncbi:MAG: ammonium transporter [Myxococcota bacterium]|nr:ammonium transporter [Myxococcota bacterium]